MKDYDDDYRWDEDTNYELPEQGDEEEDKEAPAPKKKRKRQQMCNCEVCRVKTTNETLFLEIQDLKKTVENIERLLLKLQLQMWGWAPTNNSNQTEIK